MAQNRLEPCQWVTPSNVPCAPTPELQVHIPSLAGEGEAGQGAALDGHLGAWQAGEGSAELITQTPSVQFLLSPSKFFLFENWRVSFCSVLVSY